MKIIYRMFLLFTVLCIFFIKEAISQTYPESSIPLYEVTAHIKFLAPDELKGRMTGEPGNDIAARYIAEHFRASGLISPEGVTYYFQRVPLERISPAESGELIVFSDTLEQGVEMIVLTGEKLN